MATLHKRFQCELVVLVGDNLYGSERPQDFQKKFELPYKPLLDAGVKFYASLGNHDAREQRFYKRFNMEGKLYYTFSPKPNVRFFALDSSYPVPEQIQWLCCKNNSVGETEPTANLVGRLLSFQSADFPDELNLPKDIPFRQPPHLAFPGHVQNLVALNRPPSSIERSKTLAGIHPPLDPSMVLFHNIV
jgi:hypothetical protein